MAQLCGLLQPALTRPRFLSWQGNRTTPSVVAFTDSERCVACCCGPCGSPGAVLV